MLNQKYIKFNVINVKKKSHVLNFVNPWAKTTFKSPESSTLRFVISFTRQQLKQLPNQFKYTIKKLRAQVAPLSCTPVSTNYIQNLKL